MRGSWIHMLFTVEYIYLKNKVFKMSKPTILGKNISSFLTWWHRQKWVIICRFTNLQKPAFPNCETISEKSSDIKSQRSLGTHHLQYIQSKEDDKYYRICARHKAENQYWMLMNFRPWGTTALQWAWFGHVNECMCSETLVEISIWKQFLFLQAMHFKAL